MPIIAAKIETHAQLKGTIRIHLSRAGIPRYVYKEHQEGFDIWHAEEREGEILIHWYDFLQDNDESLTAQEGGLRRCASILQDYYWIRLDMPNRNYAPVNRPTLRVLYNLSWLI